MLSNTSMLSIPAALALRFVANNNLQQRISVLQKSYKVQITGMGVFSSFEIMNNVKPWMFLNSSVFKNLSYISI